VPPGYSPAGYGYGYPKPARTDGLAVASMVLGIVSFVLCWLGVVTGILAAVFGFVSLSRIKNAAGTLSGRGMAIAGVATGLSALGIWVLFILLGTFSASLSG
jgi:hypothetical protein